MINRVIYKKKYSNVGKAGLRQMMKVSLGGLFILTLFLIVGCSKSPEEAISEAKKQNTAEAFKKFLVVYGDAPLNLRQEAEEHLYTLEFDAAKRSNTIEAYNNYALTYPSSKYARDAKKLAYDLSLIGKHVVFYESREYVLESILGGLLSRKANYNAQYSGVIESVLNNDVKVIIKKAEIADPQSVSYSYLENRDFALREIQNNIGKTRVVSKTEIEVK